LGLNADSTLNASEDKGKKANEIDAKDGSNKVLYVAMVAVLIIPPHSMCNLIPESRCCVASIGMTNGTLISITVFAILIVIVFGKIFGIVNPDDVV
jgi:hypothetical protein